MCPLPGIILTSCSFWSNGWKQQEVWSRSLIAMWVFRVICLRCLKNISLIEICFFKTQWSLTLCHTLWRKWHSEVSGRDRFHANSDKEFRDREIRCLNEKLYWNILTMQILVVGIIKCSEMLTGSLRVWGLDRWRSFRVYFLGSRLFHLIQAHFSQPPSVSVIRSEEVMLSYRQQYLCWMLVNHQAEFHVIVHKCSDWA